MPLDPNLPAAAAIAVAMGAEALAARWMGRRVYIVADTLSDVATSLGQTVLLAVFGFTMVSMYDATVARVAVVQLPTTPVVWAASFLAMEFLFYWRHRAGHELALFWAIHEVHHQSSAYNLAVAQRVGFLQWAQTWVFVLPLAFVGVPTPIFATWFAIIHFYQFLVHTQLVGRLGPLEWVFTTPSLHRVHHGRNPAYLDKNYGFTLNLFDRLFGTFALETEPARYGTLTDLPTYEPVSNNLAPWRTLARRMRAAPSWRAAAGLPWRHPAYDAEKRVVALPAASEGPTPRRIPAERPAGRAWAVVAMGVAVAVGLGLVQALPALGWGARVGLGAGYFLLITSVGAASGALISDGESS